MLDVCFYSVLFILRIRSHHISYYHSSGGWRERFSEWMHWSSKSCSSSHQIQLRCTCAFTGGSSLCHRWHTEDTQSKKFCYVLLHFLNGAVKVIPAGKKTNKKRIREITEMEGLLVFMITLPFEGHTICSNEEPLEIPPNVIHMKRWPEEFLHISYYRVHKGQRFLWWHRKDSYNSCISDDKKNMMWLKISSIGLRIHKTCYL